MTRARAFLAGSAIVTGLLLLAAIAPGLFSAPTAEAQSAPPDIPLVVYGTATGANDGASVVAIIGGQTCGHGVVLTENSQRVYAVQVAADSQVAGCGASGRVVSFYVSGSGKNYNSTGGSIASQTVTWGSSQTSEANLTFGSAFAIRGFVTEVAKDGLQ